MTLAASSGSARALCAGRCAFAKTSPVERCGPGTGGEGVLLDYVVQFWGGTSKNDRESSLGIGQNRVTGNIAELHFGLAVDLALATVAIGAVVG